MTETHTYDANGYLTDNLIQGAASLTYNAFNKVATVVQGTNTLTITYGPDRQRTKTVLVNGSNTTTTLYADNYEQRTVNGTTTTYHYVASPDGLAAVYVKSGSTATAYYIETDHLGSIIRAYDYIGNVKFSAAYDAWGNQTVSTNAIGLTRGYTGHEHWNQFGLIDMNGRFYDPLLGRFLSPDPYVQAPENPQNYNRYSYCLNNPLKYTDPTGYSLAGYDDDRRSCRHMKHYERQGGGGGYSINSLLNNIYNSSSTSSISVSVSCTFIGVWTYRWEREGTVAEDGTVNIHAYKVYDYVSIPITSVSYTTHKPRSNGDYGGSGGSIITGASYANTVINSAFKSTDKAPHANLGSNNKIYWEGKFRGNQYVTVKSLSTIAKPIARGTGILGIVISGADVGYTVYNEGYFGPESQAATAEAVGGLAGSSLGAWGGAKLGGAIGACFGGIGAIPGAVIGGFIGGVIGGIGGGLTTEKAYEWYNER